MSKSDSNQPSSPIPSSSNADHRRSDHVPISSSQAHFTFSDDEDIDLNQRTLLTAQTELMTATESITSGIETRNDSTTPLPNVSDLNEPGTLNVGNLHQLGKGASANVV